MHSSVLSAAVAVSPAAHTHTPDRHASPTHATHTPLPCKPCMPPCYTHPPAIHAPWHAHPLLRTPPATHTPLWTELLTLVKNITFPQLLLRTVKIQNQNKTQHYIFVYKFLISVNSTTSSVSSTKYDPELLRSDVALARNRVARLKRELEQINMEMQYKQQGVDRLTRYGHSFFLKNFKEKNFVNSLHGFRKVLTAGAQSAPVEGKWLGSNVSSFIILARTRKQHRFQMPWVYRQSNLMLTLSSYKDQRKNLLSRSLLKKTTLTRS